MSAMVEARSDQISFRNSKNSNDIFGKERKCAYFFAKNEGKVDF